jgi:7,8-dihydropterin-6-yl-methyl-4-(beta-D-ribofuranosyl)aminobenzene 5'-phosphate synthase
MSNRTLPLLEADEAKITVLMDNVVDSLLTSTEVAKRLNLGPDMFERPKPIAEHGFSVLIAVKRGDASGTVLFDTGENPRNILYNLDAMEVRLGDVQAIILSHGHPDHAHGLTGVVERLGTRNVPLILHPDSYLQRKLVLPNGFEINLPPPRPSDLRSENIEVIEEVGPSMLVERMLLVSGEVARTTEFEHGLPIHHAHRERGWEPDPLIMDDQCAIINLKEKGLVIVTGCGHSGIVNIVRNAQTITGVQKVHALIGGFHLSGPAFESAIDPTVAALQEINPRYIAPGHCTGWKATHEIARLMPHAFIANSVGTSYIL